MRQWCCVIGAALCLLALACGPKKEVGLKGYEQGVYLNCKAAEGKALHYESRSTVTSTTEMPGGMSQTSVISTSFRTEREIERIAGDTVMMKITYEEAEGTARVGTQSMPFPGVDKLKGVAITLTIAGGEVVDKEASDDLSPEAQPYLEETASEIKQELALFSGNRLVKPGDEWEMEYEENGKKIKAHYVLKGFEEKAGFECAKLEHNSEIKIEEEQTQMGMQVKFSGKGKETGETYFALREGYKVYEKGSASIEGKSEIPATGIELDMCMDIDAELKLIAEDE